MSAEAPLRLNDAVVSALAHAVNEGGASLASVPGLVKRAIRENCWQKRAVHVLQGEVASFSEFGAFIATAPPRGLGTDLRTLKRLCADDKDALKAIKDAGTGTHGGDRRSVAFKVGSANLEGLTKNDSGYVLRRLHNQRPDLHARVLAGELSPHAAAVEAGFRVRTISVPLDPERAARILARHFDPAELAARLLEVA